MPPPYLFISFPPLLLTPGTRKRPPQSGFVQTGFGEIRARTRFSTMTLLHSLLGTTLTDQLPTNRSIAKLPFSLFRGLIISSAVFRKSCTACDQERSIRHGLTVGRVNLCALLAAGFQEADFGTAVADHVRALA